MLHVKTRRRLAAAAVLATLVAGAVALLVVRHAYTPAAVERASREALSDITGMEARLAGVRLVGAGHVDCAECVFFDDGRKVASAAPLAIHGLLKPSGQWTVNALSVAIWRLELDLDDPAALDDMAAFLDLFERLRAYVTPAGSRQADDLSGPGLIHVEVHYGAGQPFIYKGTVMRHLGAPRLALGAYKGNRSDDSAMFPIQSSSHPTMLTLSAQPDCITLETSLPGHHEPLAQAVLAAQAPGLLEIVTPLPCELQARWTREGEEVELRAEGTWPVSEAAFAAHGIEPPEGHLDVGLRRLAFVDTSMAEAAGSVRFKAARIPGGVLLDWLAAAGMTPLGADDAPEYFESVTLSADFEVRDGLLRVRPLPDAPGVVWANVNGEEIVIFAGAGEMPLEEFLERAAKIAPQGVEDHAPGAPEDVPEDASEAAEESPEDKASPAATTSHYGQDNGARDGDDPDYAASLHPVEEEEVEEGAAE